MMKKAIGLCIFLLGSQGLVANADDSALATVDSFEKLFGVTEGKRRNHTKGFCFDAVLIPDVSVMQQYSNSSLFSGESAVIGRLSHKGGNHMAADDKAAEYGMGLSFALPSGETHLMSMNTLDFFPVATPEAFAQLMRAKAQGSAAVKAFKQKSTDLQRFKAHGATKSKRLVPYEGSTYNSLNSFYLVNADGVKTAVRWSFEPVVQQAVVMEPKQDFFFDNMQKNLADHGVTWNMVVTLANDGDVIDNAALPWKGKHKKLLAAKLKVVSISSEQQGQCETINYDPLVLSQGFAPSADPLLQARRNSYAISFGRRVSEKQTSKN